MRHNEPRVSALLLVAHGSRREASNQEIRALAARLRTHPGNRFARVEAAFLELARPSIPEGIEQSIQAGASEVIVYPYFLSAGRHVAEDIPAQVRPKQLEYPQAQILIADHLGTAAGLPELIFAQVGVHGHEG